MENLKIKLAVVFVRRVFPFQLSPAFRKSLVKSGEVLQCRYASVWRELVAFRAGEMQPGAGDTSSRQTEADATALSTFHARDERTGNDEGGPERC